MYSHTHARSRSRKRASTCAILCLICGSIQFKTQLCNDSVLFNQGICVFCFQWNDTDDDDYNYVRLVLRDQVTSSLKREVKVSVVSSINQLVKVSSFLLIQLDCFKKRLEVSDSKPLSKKETDKWGTVAIKMNSYKVCIPWLWTYRQRELWMIMWFLVRTNSHFYLSKRTMRRNQ